MFCPKCGGELREGAAFCGKCGARTPTGEGDFGHEANPDIGNAQDEPSAASLTATDAPGGTSGQQTAGKYPPQATTVNQNPSAAKDSSAQTPGTSIPNGQRETPATPFDTTQLSASPAYMQSQKSLAAGIVAVAVVVAIGIAFAAGAFGGSSETGTSTQQNEQSAIQDITDDVWDIINAQDYETANYDTVDAQIEALYQGGTKDVTDILSSLIEQGLVFQAVAIDWQTYTCENAANSNGYTFTQTLTLSPWIKADDTDTLQSAWKEIRGSNYEGYFYPASQLTMEIGSVFGSKSDLYDSGHQTTEIAYSVGYVEIKNTTEGYSLSENTKQGVNIALFCNSPFVEMLYGYGGGYKSYYTCISDYPDTEKTLETGLWRWGNLGPANYYGNHATHELGDEAYSVLANAERHSLSSAVVKTPNASMQSDIWKVPVVIAVSIETTPNSSDGVPNVSDIKFSFGLDFGEENVSEGYQTQDRFNANLDGWYDEAHLPSTFTLPTTW